MSVISLVTKLPVARGCLYIWVTLPLPRIGMNWDKNWHDASPLMGTLLDLLSRNHPLCLGSLLFGEFYLELDLLHSCVCNSIHWIGLFPKWNSIPSKSISHKEFYSWSDRVKVPDLSMRRIATICGGGRHWRSDYERVRCCALAIATPTSEAIDHAGVRSTWPRGSIPTSNRRTSMNNE
jgi:hypothetical protein